MQLGPTLLLLLLLAAPLAAQTPDTIPRPTLRAAPLTGEIRIDGHFDEPAWEAAEMATGFTQSYPNPGAVPSQRTEARVLLGEDALYVAMRMYDTRPDSIAAQLSRRDAFGTYSDRALVFIDSRLDRRTGFHFGVNPRGVKYDTYLFDDGNEDASWDGVWEVAAQIDSLGWTAEFRIPLSQLRFGKVEEGAERAWGLGLMRELARRGERSTWAPWTRQSGGFVSRFGTLTGLEGVRSPRRLELLPYATTRLSRAPDLAQGRNPFYRANTPSAAIGGDLKIGLPRGLTLSATVNPDFGQVEVDPAVVNLSAFETSFPERRPFFTEGVDVFRFGDTRAFSRYNSQQYFYSRRIGRSPQRLLRGPGYVFVDAPAQTTILGAAKVSGRTPGGWSVGIMDAITGREEARFIDAAGEEQGTAVEPLSNYLVARVRRDLRGGNTVVGGLLTATHRSMADSVFVPLLHESAYLGGIDFEHSWKRRRWALGGYIVGSRVAGEPRAIALTQGRPSRYYARPDADYVELDPTRTWLGGSMAELALSRYGDWDGSLLLKQVSPGFEINDLGFQGRTDYRSVSAMLGRRIDRLRGPFRRHSYYATANGAWNFGGERIFNSFSTGANGSFRNFWSAEVRGVARPEVADDRLTRGGPLALRAQSYDVALSVATDPRKQLSFSTFASGSWNAAGGFDRSANIQADIRPSTALRVRVGPSWSQGHTIDQYVRVDNDPRALNTFGRRYLFAELDQTTVSMDTRVEWTFTPNLSLQLFAQPFVSAGNYERFKEFASPGTRDYAVYGEDRGTICEFTVGGSRSYAADPVGSASCPEALASRNTPEGARFTTRFGDPDFNVRSLRGNAVLRWEYRPGSTLFLVWQQDRSGFLSAGDFDFRRDSGALFREPARNVFLIKGTYWIGR